MCMNRKYPVLILKEIVYYNYTPDMSLKYVVNFIIVDYIIIFIHKILKFFTLEQLKLKNLFILLY